MTPGTGRTVEYEPFYGAARTWPQHRQHRLLARMRRPSMRKGRLGQRRLSSAWSIRTSRCCPPRSTCSTSRRSAPIARCRHDSPSATRPATSDWREGPASRRSSRCAKPTDPIPAPIADENRWRLVSHLSLNYVSIPDSGSGTADGDGRALEALRELLGLYDFSDSPVARQRIAGIVGIRCRRVRRRVGRGAGTGFARGLEVELEFDASQYTGAGVYLFASVLERFLGLYTSINSFTQIVARVRQREEELKRWAPRAGEAHAPLNESLYHRPSRFEFFQAVRLLRRLRGWRASASVATTTPTRRRCDSDRTCRSGSRRATS